MCYVRQTIADWAKTTVSQVKQDLKLLKVLTGL